MSLNYQLSTVNSPLQNPCSFVSECKGTTFYETDKTFHHFFSLKHKKCPINQYTWGIKEGREPSDSLPFLIFDQLLTWFLAPVQHHRHTGASYLYVLIGENHAYRAYVLCKSRIREGYVAWKWCFSWFCFSVSWESRIFVNFFGGAYGCASVFRWKILYIINIL